MASALNYMDRMALNQTAARIKDAFGLNNEQYSYLESSFGLGFAVGAPLVGWLVDRAGVRWMYPLCVLGWSAFGFLTGFVPGFWLLFACRFGLGVFEAGNWPCGIRTTRQVMAPAERSLGNAFFQNGTAIGAIVTPFVVLACLDWAGKDRPDAWQVPFRAVGVVGLGWVALWLFTVPARVVRPKPDESAGPGRAGTPFAAVFRDRRYWLLLALVLAVNTSWHTFRVWLPLFLQEQHGYSEKDMAWVSTAYYVTADAGVWAVGLGSLVLARWGFTIHQSRVVSFAACAAIGLVCLALPFLGPGPALTAVLLLYGFGAYGLFPTYFALSQDVSARHQGKVTGTLGSFNSIYLAGMYWAEGVAADQSGNRYDLVMAAAGLPAVAALLLLVLFWKVPGPEEKSP
jgi:ACS family hexuronate transporter-like MFS transporter